MGDGCKGALSEAEQLLCSTHPHRNKQNRSAVRRMPRESSQNLALPLPLSESTPPPPTQPLARGGEKGRGSAFLLGKRQRTKKQEDHYAFSLFLHAE